jgi:hypothetical protein
VDTEETKAPKGLSLVERLASCKICQNRKPNLSIGMVCGLTNEKPAFNAKCDLMEIDKKAVEKNKYTDKEDFEPSQLTKLLTIYFVVFNIINTFFIIYLQTRGNGYSNAELQSFSFLILFWGFSIIGLFFLFFSATKKDFIRMENWALAFLCTPIPTFIIVRAFS